MRSRSVSVYAKRPAIIPPVAPQDPLLINSDLPAELPTLCLKKSYSAEEHSTLFEDFGPVVECNFKEDFSGDFCRNSRASIDTASSSLYGSQVTSKGSCLSTGFEGIFDDDEIEKTQKLFRGMVIGAHGVGKRTLVNAMFPEDTNKVCDSDKQAFDLLTRAVDMPDSTERYHFWLKETDIENTMFDSLFNMYYKSSSLIFLVYDTEDRSSFYKLHRDLERMREANTEKKKPFLILVGNKASSVNSKKITCNEICALKAQHNIQVSLEVNVSEGVPTELRGFVESFLKQN